jgi:hypothetical protein
MKNKSSSRNHHDIFISYRRETGTELALLVKNNLQQKGFQVFMDIETLKSGKFDEELYLKIEEAEDFIVILTPGCLDRCINSDDWFRLEIRYAIKYSKNIIPIMARGFQMPARHELPEDISELPRYNGITPDNTLFEKSMDKLAAQFLKSHKKSHVRQFIKKNVTLLKIIFLIILTGIGICILTDFDLNISNFYKQISLHLNKNKTENKKSSLTESSNNNIYIFSESKQKVTFALLHKQLQQENELRSKFETNGTGYAKEKIKLINQQRDALDSLLNDINSALSNLKPKNFVEGFDICNMYFDIILNDNIKITQSIWLKSNMDCFFTTTTDMAAFAKKITNANLTTWTNLKKVNINFNDASLVPIQNSSNTEAIPNESFSRDFFISHRTRVNNIDKKFRELLANKTLLNNAKSDTTIIFYFHPLLKDFIAEKILLEKVIKNSRIIDESTQKVADVAQMEMDYAICYFILSYNYNLLKEKERIDLLIDFLSIQKEYISCRDIWTKGIF